MIRSIEKLFIAVFLSIYTCSVLAEPLELRFTPNAASATPKAMMATHLQSLVKKRFGDDVLKITILSEKKYKNDSQLLSAVLKGNTDIALPSTSSIKRYSPRFQIFDLPFIFSSTTAAQKFVASSFGLRLLNILKPNGLHGFGYLVDGMRQISSNTLMVDPSDLKGLNIQVSSFVIEGTWLRKIGATPVKTPVSSVYDELKKGKLDGQMNIWLNIYANKIHEQQSFIVESDHSLLANVVLMSESAWNKIPKNNRLEFTKLMTEAIAYGNSLLRDRDKKNRQAIIEAGKAKIYKLTLGQRQVWTETMLPVWRRFESQIGEELIQAATSVR